MNVLLRLTQNGRKWYLLFFRTQIQPFWVCHQRTAWGWGPRCQSVLPWAPPAPSPPGVRGRPSSSHPLRIFRVLFLCQCPIHRQLCEQHACFFALSLTASAFAALGPSLSFSVVQRSCSPASAFPALFPPFRSPLLILQEGDNHGCPWFLGQPEAVTASVCVITILDWDYCEVVGEDIVWLVGNALQCELGWMAAERKCKGLGFTDTDSPSRCSWRKHLPRQRERLRHFCLSGFFLGGGNIYYVSSIDM